MGGNAHSRCKQSYETLDRVLNAFKFYVVEGRTVVAHQLDRASAVAHEILGWSRIKCIFPTRP
jgi:hypothetical protein